MIPIFTATMAALKRAVSVMPTTSTMVISEHHDPGGQIEHRARQMQVVTRPSRQWARWPRRADNRSRTDATD